jgi:hypothetical protein
MDNHCCDTGKVCYETHGQATANFAGLVQRSLKKHKYSTYKCDRCGHYHISTFTKKRLSVKKESKYPFRYEPPPQQIKTKKKKK